MKRQAHIALTATMIAAIPIFTSPACATGTDDDFLEELVVTAERRAQPALRHTGNVALLTSEEITDVAHQHIYDIMTRVPGTWLSRGSGQEHLTAIRSPVLTGPGSCGAFLTLEDGIPSRPAGFCNVNQMFELFTEQADSIEVIRGP
ncbi:MAG TPA: TonB-dependent receptor plug domain-containing protein, partial [Woeseiaceae bacterium]